MSLSSPGLEFHSLLSVNLQVEAWDRLDELFSIYLETLHGANPETKAYTKEMLTEDYAIAFRLVNMGAIVFMAKAFADPNSILWKILPVLLPRQEKCIEKLKVADVCRNIAIENGLIPKE